jgi:hypothetical protein
MEASQLGTSPQVEPRATTGEGWLRPGRRPDGSRRTPLLGFASIVVVGTVLFGAVFAWQHQRVVVAETGLAATRSQLTTSRTEAAQLRSENDVLRGHAAAIRSDLASTRHRLRASSSQAGALANRIADLRARLTDARTSLEAARAEGASARDALARLAGAPLPDGTYRVRVLAAQAATSPPRILVSQPFVEGEWRLLAVGPHVRVSIVRPASGARTSLPLGTFGKVLRRNVVQQSPVKAAPYAIVLKAGRVERIVEKPSGQA